MCRRELRRHQAMAVVLVLMAGLGPASASTDSAGCPAGKYAAPGYTRCRQCRRGKFSLGAAIGCKLCPRGKLCAFAVHTFCAYTRLIYSAPPFRGCHTGRYGLGKSSTAACDGPCSAGRFGRTSLSPALPAPKPGHHSPPAGISKTSPPPSASMRVLLASSAPPALPTAPRARRASMQVPAAAPAARSVLLAASRPRPSAVRR